MNKQDNDFLNGIEDDITEKQKSEDIKTAIEVGMTEWDV